MVISIVPLEAGHWNQVRGIYLEGIATGQATFETGAPEWSAWDEARLPHSRLGAIRDGELVGWAALSAVSKRPVYAGVAEVSVYVAAAARGQGVGRRLLAALVASAEQNGIWTLQGGIFPENEASVSLHQQAGFRVVGKRERLAVLQGVWRDVLLLERRSAVVGL